MFLFEILFTLTLHVCVKLVWMMSTFISFSTVTISLTRYMIPEQRKVKNLKLWGFLCRDQYNFLIHIPFTFLVSLIPEENRVKLCVLIRIFSIYGLQQQKKKNIYSRAVVGKRSGPGLNACDCHLHFLRTDVKSENGFMIHNWVWLRAFCMKYW